MKLLELTEFLVKSLVSEPDMVSVKEFDDEDLVTIVVMVAKKDMGKVIGRQGKIIKAIRTLVSASSYMNNLPKVKIDNTAEVSVPEYDILQEVRQLLIDVRKELGISQKELSEKTNIPQASISKFENGHNVPSLQILQRLADGLGKRLIVDFVEPEEED